MSAKNRLFSLWSPIKNVLSAIMDYYICTGSEIIRLKPINNMIAVAENYLCTGTKTRLLDPTVPINGVIPRLIDDLDEDTEGNIYWTDASTIGDLSEGLVEFLAGPSGR